MAIGKIVGAGKIIQDGKLMADIGFNIERTKKAEREEKGVIDLDTSRDQLRKEEEFMSPPGRPKMILLRFTSSTRIDGQLRIREYGFYHKDGAYMILPEES